MPCQDYGGTEARGMDPGEVWKSLSRHHRVLEIETEKWRAWGQAVQEQFAQIEQVLPSLKLAARPPMPTKTPDWHGQTYRDRNGKFPNDINTRLDWLSEEDFK